MSGALAAASGAASAFGNNEQIVLNDHLVVASGAGPNSAAGIRVSRDGKILTGTDLSGTSPSFTDVGGDEWAVNEAADVGDPFEVQIITSTGTLSSGNSDTWEALTSDRTYQVNQSGDGSKSFTGEMQIQRQSGGGVIARADITLTAIVVSV